MPKSLRSHAASLVVAACIVFLGGAVDHAGASEFIYGHTSWTAASGNTVQFTVRGAFRRSGMPCIDLTTNSQTDCAPGDGFAQVGDVVVEDNGGTSLDPGDGNAPVGPLYYQVSAIDPTLDLLTALALDPASLPARSTTIPYTYATAGSFTAVIEACCRTFDQINNPFEYRIETLVNVGSGNSSPQSTLPPLVLCPPSGLCVFTVPAIDPDGDTLQFRLSTPAEAGGSFGFIQPGPPFATNGASIDPHTGEYSWDTTGATISGERTPYSTQVSIEDLDAGGTPQSKVAVDFMIILTCQSNADCNDGDPCTDDTCDPQNGCFHTNNTASCDDGDACTVNDTCNAGVCAGQTAPDGTACDDGNACDGGETCQAGICSPGTPLDCDDQNACTADSCNPLTGCQHTAVLDATPCDDGNACTTGETCQTGVCTGQAVTDGSPCSDGNACTVGDACQAGACVSTPAADGTACTDDNACTIADSCQSGTCVGTPAPDSTPCDDGAACTTGDTCQGGTCTGTPVANGTPCDDGNICTDLDTCEGGACVGIPLTTTPCDDGNACTTVDTCENGRCAGSVPASDGSACDDQNGCTSSDACLNGACAGQPVQDGLACGVAGPCITDATCQNGTCYAAPAPNGSACDDANSCTSGESCENGACVGGSLLDGVACNAGNPCATNDTCRSGTCIGDPLPNGTACDDRNGCTVDDTCQAGACVGGPAPHDTLCDDGNPCTIGETCQNGACLGTAITGASCDDGSSCSVSDTCQNGLCAGSTLADGSACQDGNACTGGEACLSGFCLGGSAISCDDGNPCTDDSCDAVLGCLHVNNTAACDDGDACTTGDTCNGGACVAHALCDDGNPCTDDSCTAGVCANVPNVAPCDDGNACTTGDTCLAGACVGGPAPDCNDGNVCTDDGCNPASGCTHTNNAAACDDGNTCTVSDTCQGGVCAGRFICDDGNPCTDDTCDGAGGCLHSNNTAPCEDGNPCTASDTCQDGACVGGAAPTCDDGNPCTDDGCDPVSGCIHVNNMAPCDDANPCTMGDTCQGGTCTATTTQNCDDSNPCTDDTCDGAGGCLHTNNTAPCNDGDACTTDTCQDGVCVGTPGPCTDPNCNNLVGMGPVSPAHGFPEYYQDRNNLALQPCLDFVCDPLLPVPNRNAPISFPDNFPVETFYQRAIATMNGPGGETFLLDLGLEGSFLNGNVAKAGDQIVFTRVRVRATGVVPGATYTVTHPYGVETLTANGTPPRLINFTRDIGLVPLAFGMALNGDHGRFLTFLAGATPPPPGTIGNPAANQTVTGSPCGNNFFRIEGPGLPSGGVQTDQFSTVIGRVANVCGNGILDRGEQCDDGNNVDGDCCSSSCRFEAAGSACDDGNPCTDNSTCTATGVCQVTGFNTNPCNDGNACTTDDTCASGTCVGGPARDCNDHNVCTDDTCDPASGCVSTNNTASCDDGDACTQIDTCSNGSCSGGNPVVCTALDQCHDAGVCDPQTGTCSNPSKADGTACDDGSACTQGDTCQAGTCTPGTPVVCTALDQCHDAGTCDPANGTCSNPNKTDGTACGDGDACTQSDSCQAGTCTPGTPVVCTALDQCHDAGGCDPQTGTCSNPSKADGTACSDGNACTQTDTCQAGTCTGANPVLCTALDQCHDAGSCDPQTGTCSNPNKTDGTACSDGNACTQSDSCQAGACVGATPVVCTALDQCHDAGTCDPANGTCSNPSKADGSTCSDGNACTQSDTCQAGTCTGANPVLCTAFDQCHDAGTCDPANGTCSNPNKADGSTCSDGNACTQSDSCQAGACVGTNPVVCTALGQCHDAGTCDPQTGTCSNPEKPDGTACTDSDACTQTDTCQSGVCSGANPVVCSALDQCHDAGVCDPANGACSNPAKANGSACDDGDACTQTDTCRAGVCNGRNPVVCTALDQCHDAGVCDPANGTCSNPATANGTACTDGDACTQTDTCEAGACVGANPVVCAALDQCHVAGICDPASGTCSNPDKLDGTACNDGSACTQSDSCQAGVCTGANPVVCGALDQCHVAGVCDPASGACSNPAKPNGSTCTDGDACTQTDTCEAGACVGTNPVVCAALDQCHDAGVCDPASGICSTPAKADGSACTDGDACTQSDTCQAGACVGTNPIVCAALDQCHVAGTCDPTSGICSTPSKADGSACDDGDACTQTDTCQAGTCTGSDPVICESDPQCPRICDPATGLCPSPDASNGTACDDGTFCTVNDVCTSGVCRGVPRNCTFLTDQCNDGVCNEADGRCEAAPRVDGTACQADSDPCTTDTCEAGSCTATPVVCAPQDICHLPGTCDAATGTCTNPEIACDDSDPCTADSCDPASGCVFQPVTGFAAATCIFEGSSLRPAVCQRMPRHIQNRITRAARRITLAAAADGNLKKVRLARASRDLKVAMKKARRLAQKRKPRDCAQALLGALRDARNRVQQLRRAL